MDTDLLNEAKLITRARTQPEAFGILFEKYYDQIFGYILKRVANFELAQDIVSEVFFKALKNLWRFRWKKVPFSAWLYQIALNEIRHYFRKKTYQTLSLNMLTEDTEFEVKSDEDIHQEMIERQTELERYQTFLHVQKLVAELPLHFLGKKEGTIKSLLSRGLQLLRGRLEEHHPALQPFAKLRIMKQEGLEINL